MPERRPIILALLGAYWPGNDATGPNTTFRAMTAQLRDEFDFRVIARDRPWGARAPVVQSSHWLPLPGVGEGLFLPVGPLGAQGLASAFRATPHDAVLLNGFFDREFTIPALAVRRFRRVPLRGTIVSPRGEFSGGALALKAGRKHAYRRLARASRLLNGVILHATSAAEQADLTAAFPHNRVRLASNIRAVPPLPPHTPRQAGGPLRLAFVGRISRVKGLDLALQALALVGNPAVFDIYGPASDPDHWAECQWLIAALPARIRVRYHGEIANDAVPSTLAAVDALLLPSRSENFGHAIFESLAAGTPIIIGQATPWRGLAVTGAGFDVPLTPAAIAEAVERIAARDSASLSAGRAAARGFVEHFVAHNRADGDMRALLREAVASR